MTKMPEMVALLNGLGGLSSLLVGWGIYLLEPNLTPFSSIATFLTVLIGSITFSGSIIAWGKLSEIFSGKPFLFRGQKIFNLFLLLSALCLGIIFTVQMTHFSLLLLISFSLLIGIFSILPIGGADMPVVISLLNSYSGLAACAAGFVVENIVLIVSGALVGASGMILTAIMCKAMNRSLRNVLFSGFGSVKTKKEKEEEGEVQTSTAEDAFYVLEAAKSIVIVPGYGLAVAQAQHAIRELAALLESHDIDVKYAIHPVAGRMPGHMNVLLAEADVPYEQLIEMEDINRIMSSVDVCLVIGANDVVNTAARDDTTSPIYGMPIIQADKAKNVFILKRSMASGFAGIPNPLFFNENTRMLFGDAKQTLQAIIAEF